MKKAWMCGIVLALLIGYTVVVNAATIITTDDNRIVGDIVEENDEWIIVRSSEGLDTKIPRSKIASIIYIENLSSLYKKEYPVFGVTFGTPAGINLVTGYYFEHFGLRLSGFSWGSTHGVQVNILKKISESPKFLHNFSLLAGTSVSEGEYSWEEDDKWNYFGVGYDLNWYKFFLELVVTAGSGTYESPQLGLQIGYVNRFNRK